MKTKILSIFIAFCLLLIATYTNAGIKRFTCTVRQPFGGSQAPDDARVAAMNKAKREVLEKAGTYLESLTIIKESMVEKDEILAIAAGVLKTEIVSQKNYISGDSFGIIITVRVDVDMSILENRVKKLLKDKKHLSELKDIRKREKKLLAKIKKLEEKNKRLQLKKPSKSLESDRKDLKMNFQKATKALRATE